MAMDSEQRSGAHACAGGGGGGGGGYYEFLRKLYGPGPGAAPSRSVLGADVNWLLELGPVPLELDPPRRTHVDPQTLPLGSTPRRTSWGATRPPSASTTCSTSRSGFRRSPSPIQVSALETHNYWISVLAN